MRKRGGRCKGNYAVIVKIIMPTLTLRGTLGQRVIWLIS